MDLYIYYRGLERRCKNLLKAKKRSYWPRYVKHLKLSTSLMELQSMVKRMRNSKATNESERVSGAWLEPFAQKVCPDFAQVPPFQQSAHGSDPQMDSPFTMVELSLALYSSNNSSPGLDQIRNKLLHNLPDLARKRLLKLFNIMLELNTVPLEWREVKVVTLLKPGKPPSECNSYRPIAMLSCLRKLFELLFALIVLIRQLGTGRVPVNRFARIIVQQISNSYDNYKIH